MSFTDEFIPLIQCPSSNTEYLSSLSEFRVVHINQSQFTTSDNIGIMSLTFTPNYLNVSIATLNKAVTVYGNVTDLDGNSASCWFQINVRGKLVLRIRI